MVRQEVNNFGSSLVVQALVLQSYVHFYNDILDFLAENYFLIDSHKKTFLKQHAPLFCILNCGEQHREELCYMLFSERNVKFLRVFFPDFCIYHKSTV